MYSKTIDWSFVDEIFYEQSLMTEMNISFSSSLKKAIVYFWFLLPILIESSAFVKNSGLSINKGVAWDD